MRKSKCVRERYMRNIYVLNVKERMRERDDENPEKMGKILKRWEKPENTVKILKRQWKS